MFHVKHILNFFKKLFLVLTLPIRIPYRIFKFFHPLFYDMIGPVTIVFGLPRSGKSCHAVTLVKTALKRGQRVFCNFPVDGAIPFNIKDVGVIDMSSSLVIVDEAGICMNNRKFKDMPLATIEFFKLIGHYRSRAVIYSQSYDDMDITVRRLASGLWLMRKGILGTSVLRPIRRYVGVDDERHEICDQYSMDGPFIGLFTKRRFFRPFTYRYFDSYAAPALKNVSRETYSCIRPSIFRRFCNWTRSFKLPFSDMVARCFCAHIPKIVSKRKGGKALPPEFRL